MFISQSIPYPCSYAGATQATGDGHCISIKRPLLWIQVQTSPASLSRFREYLDWLSIERGACLLKDCGKGLEQGCQTNSPWARSSLPGNPDDCEMCEYWKKHPISHMIAVPLSDHWGELSCKDLGTVSSHALSTFQACGMLHVWAKLETSTI